jgi:DNA-binding NtrC family response regulator
LPTNPKRFELPEPIVKLAWKKLDSTNRSIVIVDDEKSYAELIAQMIADNLDCTVYAFTRPMEALGSLNKISAGVVVTDYSMPQMNGIEFIKRASRIAPSAAFILISGDDLDPLCDELARLRRLKMRLRKPFGWRPLADAVLNVWPGRDIPSFRSNGSTDHANNPHLGAVKPQP